MIAGTLSGRVGECRKAHEEVQKATDDFIKNLDELGKSKEQDILKV